TVLLGNGDGTFQPLHRYPLPVGGAPIGLVSADFNGDGVPDLAAANGAQAAVAIFLGGTVTTGKLLNVPVIGLNQAIQSTYTPNLGFYTGSLSNQVIINGGGQVATVTTVALTMGTNPSSYGQPLTFTATVTANGGGSPTGNVSFTADGGVIAGCGAVQLAPQPNGSTASCQTSTLTVGSHTIVATYSGDQNFTGSMGTLVPNQMVNKADTQTALTAIPPNQSDYLQLVTFTATVTGAFGGSPTGTVTFTNGANPICTAVPLAPQVN